MHLRKKTYKNLNESPPRFLYIFNSIIWVLQTKRNESGFGGRGDGGVGGGGAVKIQPTSFLCYVRYFVPRGAC